jgi:cytochrome c peroxidase
MRRSLLLSLVALTSIACAEDSEPAAPSAGPADRLTELPDLYPTPRLPDGFSPEVAELGRHLFYDPRLSGNETQSCSSCHLQNLAFTDGRDVALGSTGEMHFRNSQTLTNVAYNSTLTWASSVVSELAAQALIPMFGESPVELGMAGREEELLQRLSADATYGRLFSAAFGDSAPSIARITQALASFQTTLVSHESAYDDFLYRGQTTALNDEQYLGLQLFFDERFECFHCHGGFNFADATVHAGTGIVESPFHNTGVYNVDGSGAYPEKDQGLLEITLRPEDMGRFRAPTLRNIEMTGPYFHDGSALTLRDVIDHYDRGGRNVTDGPWIGDGALSPIRSSFVRPINMTDEEKSALIAFLESLTDEPFMTDPRLANPWTR